MPRDKFEGGVKDAIEEIMKGAMQNEFDHSEVKDYKQKLVAKSGLVNYCGHDEFEAKEKKLEGVKDPTSMKATNDLERCCLTMRLKLAEGRLQD
eukprot:14560875-Alexandrium_andersonii.AAC.1